MSRLIWTIRALAVAGGLAALLLVAARAELMALAGPFGGLASLVALAVAIALAELALLAATAWLLARRRSEARALLAPWACHLALWALVLAVPWEALWQERLWRSREADYARVVARIEAGELRPRDGELRLPRELAHLSVPDGRVATSGAGPTLQVVFLAERSGLDHYRAVHYTALDRPPEPLHHGGAYVSTRRIMPRWYFVTD